MKIKTNVSEQWLHIGAWSVLAITLMLPGCASSTLPGSPGTPTTLEQSDLAEVHFTDPRARTEVAWEHKGDKLASSGQIGEAIYCERQAFEAAKNIPDSYFKDAQRIRMLGQETAERREDTDADIALANLYQKNGENKACVAWAKRFLVFFPYDAKAKSLKDECSQ